MNVFMFCFGSPQQQNGLRAKLLLIWVDVFCHSAPEWRIVSNRVVIFITLAFRAVSFFAIPQIKFQLSGYCIAV